MAKIYTTSERWRLLFTRPNLLEAPEDQEDQDRVLRLLLAKRQTPRISRRIVLRPRRDQAREPGRPCVCCFEVVDSWQPLIACGSCLTVYHAACAAAADPCPHCGISGDPPALPVDLPWNRGGLGDLEG